MKKIKLLTLTIFALTIISCAKPETSEPATAVEYGKACDATNKDKTVAVQGFLNAAEKTPCMKMMRLDKNKRMVRDCAFKLLDKVNVVGSEMIAYVQEGTENNQVVTPDAGNPNSKPSSIFSRGDLKIHLSDGTEIVPQENIGTPVTITGEIKLTDGSGGGTICSITATKVEKR